MPPRDTVGRSDKGPTRSRRTSAQIKKRGTAKAAASRLKSRIKERRKKKAREAAARQRAALSRSAGEVGRGVAANKSATQVAAERKAAATKQRNVLSSRAGERGRGVPASRTVSGGRGFTVERPGARTAVAGGRGRTVERPGERAAALAAQRRRAAAAAAARNAAANKQAAQSLLGAGYRNVAGDRNRSTLGQQFMSGIRNLMRGELGFVIPGSGGKRNPSVDDFKRRRRRKKSGGGDDVVTTDTTTETTPVTEMPPEIIEDYSDRFPTGPGYGGGMMGGLGGFGYSPALMAYESQQGAGQVPYYMAAARNAMTPNMSPAFMHAARNYDILGGMQRTRARPIEMMSARERAEIMNMGSNFNVPNYNSPYPQSSGQSQFDYFRDMVRDSATPVTQPQVDRNMFPTSGIPTGPGKGAARPMSQDQVRAMGSGLGSLMRSGMMGMF